MLETEELLEKHGWTEECGSPFEIRHTDGSFATGSAAWTVLSVLRSEELEEHPQFEYKTVDLPYHKRDKFIDILNEHGNDGWEVCHIITCDMTPSTAFFKRKKE